MNNKLDRLVHLVNIAGSGGAGKGRALSKQALGHPVNAAGREIRVHPNGGSVAKETLASALASFLVQPN